MIIPVIRKNDQIVVLSFLSGLYDGQRASQAFLPLHWCGKPGMKKGDHRNIVFHCRQFGAHKCASGGADEAAIGSRTSGLRAQRSCGLTRFGRRRKKRRSLSM
eukprot:4051739-Amphidinium_carterae.1